MEKFTDTYNYRPASVYSHYDPTPQRPNSPPLITDRRARSSQPNTPSLQLITTMSGAQADGGVVSKNMLDLTHAMREERIGELQLVSNRNWTPAIVFENEMRFIGRCVVREEGQLIPTICNNFELAAWSILHMIEVIFLRISLCNIFSMMTTDSDACFATKR